MHSFYQRNPGAFLYASGFFCVPATQSLEIFYHQSFAHPKKSSIFADMKQEIIDKINRLASQEEPFLFVINYQGDKKVSLFNAMIDFGEREVTEIFPPDSAD